MKIDTTVYHDNLVMGQPYKVFQPFGSFVNNNYWFNLYSTNAEVEAFVDWCYNTFGSWSEYYESGFPHRWYFQNGNMWFRDDADVELFLLRWS